MLRFIGRILQWLRGGALKLLAIAGAILLIWGIVSPVGTLVWWFQQGSELLGLKQNRSKYSQPRSRSLRAPNSTSIPKSKEINCYIVFLPGVGDFSADELTPGETAFLNNLVQTHPNCVAVGDVFPYSVANKSLGGQRAMAPVWRFANEAKSSLPIADVLIKIRNLWRFAISADPRYGTIYNQGIASAIIDRMNAKHPIPQDSSQPIKIILIGTSGGAEVSLNAVPYLKQQLNANVTVLSIGGVFNGKNGFDASDHVYHFRGRRDLIEDIGGIVFPSRWLWNVASPFTQARMAGRYTSTISGPHAHDGPEGYFGEAPVAGNGITYVDLTLQQVNQLPIWSEQKPQKTQQ